MLTLRYKVIANVKSSLVTSLFLYSNHFATDSTYTKVGKILGLVFGFGHTQWCLGLNTGSVLRYHSRCSGDYAGYEILNLGRPCARQMA